MGLFEFFDFEPTPNPEPMWFVESPRPVVTLDYYANRYQFTVRASWRAYAFLHSLPCVEESALDPQNRGLLVILKPDYAWNSTEAIRCRDAVMERLALYSNTVWGEAVESAFTHQEFDPDATRPYPPFRMEHEISDQ